MTGFPKVDKFLCCCHLEPALVIIAMIGILIDVILLVLLLVLAFDSSYCYNEGLTKGYFKNVQQCRTMVTVLLCIWIIIFSGLMVVIYAFIVGVVNRDRSLIAPLKFVLGITSMVAYIMTIRKIYELILLSGGINYEIIYLSICPIVTCIIVGYLNLCVNSVYEKMRDEQIKIPASQPV